MESWKPFGPRSLWAAERMEFGTTHAIAGAADWLSLHDNHAADADERLAAIGEILGHIAEDARGGGVFPFAPGDAAWSEAAFLQAIEAEDEALAASLLRAAVGYARKARELLPALARAALAHYADFGHSLIYVVQTVVLIERLGEAVAEPLLQMLVRSLVYARREDLLPEFRDILEAAGWQLLHVDESRFAATCSKIADNYGWLDFTHALTFARAGVVAAEAAPDLWPAILLQLACFIGRNATCVDPYKQG